MLETKSNIVLSKSLQKEVIEKTVAAYNFIYLEFWEKQPGTADRVGRGYIDKTIKLVPEEDFMGWCNCSPS